MPPAPRRNTASCSGFVHHPSSFTEESRPLLRFLLREFEDLQAQQEILKVYGNTRLGKELPLSPGGFDRFFELYAGSCVDFRENGRVRSIRLMDENPPLTIQVHAPEEGGGLLLRTEDAGSIQGAAHFYVLHGTRLYRCAEDYASHMTEWISTIQTAQTALFIAGDDLPPFAHRCCRSSAPISGWRVTPTVWSPTSPVRWNAPFIWTRRTRKPSPPGWNAGTETMCSIRTRKGRRPLS